MLKLRKGDQVIVRTGKDKGQQGPILSILKNNKALVEGINVVKKHQKPNPTQGVSGGIIKKPMPIDLSNIGLLNPETKKAGRVGIRLLEDGKKVRYFKSTNEVVDV